MKAHVCVPPLCAKRRVGHQGAPPGHAPPGPRTPGVVFRPGARTRGKGAPPRGCPFAFALPREPAGEGGGGCFRAAARSRLALAREPGKGGAAQAPPVRLPLCRMHRGGGAASARRPPRANPGEGRCSRLERAPRSRTARCGGRPVSPPRAPLICVSPLRANQGLGAAAPPLALRAWSPVRRGKEPCARLAPHRPTLRVLFVKRGGGGRGTYLARAAPRSCASPPLRANGSGGGRGLSRVRMPCSRVNEGGGGDTCRAPIARTGGRAPSPVCESTGAEAGAVFGSPVRRERGQGRKRGRTCPAPPLRASGGRGQRGGCVPPARPPFAGQPRRGCKGGLAPRGPALACRTGSGKGGQRMRGGAARRKGKGD
ncbi:hypothetical protein EDB92DRAFT_1817099 [Lactarius akahatsu]|uniref:Uncharacterized protein n=1 Tax=Lactarius akahatsu TaxID=416441 RepID=A0AAD4LG11_9AGAM|nr:hypothetical protein EDB92DRAFT_1817099 [Lactarius akahatsu]